VKVNRFDKMKLLETIKKQGGFNLIKQYIRSGVLITAISQFCLLGKSRTALEILRLSTQYKVKQKLYKKYIKKIEQIEADYIHKEVKIERKIWFCWLQGIENAPEIVKICYKSLLRNIKDREIVVITYDNYKKYIQFPNFIQNKIDKNIITGAHMTDLIRLELLDKYGGTWIDATVYCSSENIPSYMLNSDLFLFQCLKPGKDGHTSCISNWFITAKSHQKLLYIEKEILFEYWKNNDKLMDYFIFHLFFQIIIEKYPDEWAKVVPVSNSTPHILLLRLFDEYNSEIWEAISKAMPFHKLSYKFDTNKTEIRDTYFKNVIKETD